jgi:hypothetical protein
MYASVLLSHSEEFRAYVHVHEAMANNQYLLITTRTVEWLTGEGR